MRKYILSRSILTLILISIIIFPVFPVHADGNKNKRPAEPQDINAISGNDQVLLSWSPPEEEENGRSPITSYVIHYGTSRDEDELTNQIITGSTSTSYTVTGLTAGTKYYFEVSAENGAGIGDTSDKVSATPYTVSSAPSSPTATPGNQQITLSWAPPSSNGGSAITSYTINYGPR